MAEPLEQRAAACNIAQYRRNIVAYNHGEEHKLAGGGGSAGKKKATRHRISARWASAIDLKDHLP